MIKQFVLALFILVSTFASATNIYFDYSGSGFTGSGVFTGVTGQQNGTPFSGVEPLGTNSGYIYDNLVFLNSTPQLDLDGVLLSWNGGDVNLGNGGGYEIWSSWGTYSLDNFSASTPEPSTLLMLGSGLIGLAGLTRKRLFR
jgi:PEP-CTERM motif